jgi:hypothetical protein
MGISINGKVDESRKWPEIHQPQKIVEAHPSEREGRHRGYGCPSSRENTDLPPHYPWLPQGG